MAYCPGMDGLAGLPEESVRVTCRGLAKAVPTSVDCGVGDAEKTDGGPVRLVREYAADTPSAVEITV